MEQPKGLFVLSGTELWERFGFYTFSAILALFMVEVLHFNLAFASLIYGAIISSTYLFQLFGGIISDKYIGSRRGIYLGGFLMIISHLIMAYSASLYPSSINIAAHSSFIFTFQECIFIIGACILAIGSGFFYVNTTSLVGSLYKQDDSRLDSAFTIFYMCVNIGGLFGPLVASIVVGDGHPELYQYGFLIAATCIGISLLIFTYFKNKYLISPTGDPVGVIALAKDKKFISQIKTTSNSNKLSKIEIDRIKVITVLCIVAIIFFICLEQKFTAMLFFIQKYVDTTIPMLDMRISPEFFLSINPIAVIILAPIFAKVWLILGHRNKEPSIVTKMGVGLLTMAIAYFLLSFGFGMIENGAVKIALTWIIAFDLLQTTSELLISPTGLSLVTKLAPAGYTSTFMGLWYVATALAELLAGYFAGFYPDPSIDVINYIFGFIPMDNLVSYSYIFITISLVSGIICLLFKSRIIKLMHGIK